MIISFHKELGFNEIRDKADMGFQRINFAQLQLSPLPDLSGTEYAIISENPVYVLAAVKACWEHGISPIILNHKFSAQETNYLVDELCIERLLTGEGQGVSWNDFATHGIQTDSSGSQNTLNTELQGGIKLLGSGSSGKHRIVELTAENLKFAFETGNQVLRYSNDDKWLLSLPLHHISGFSIFIRALLSNAELYVTKTLKNNELQDVIFKGNVTMVSLVPTQLSDIVKHHVRAPASLRYSLIGGAPSKPELIEKAIKLGWNPVRVYGSTETAAFISALMPSDFSKKVFSAGRALPGVRLRINASIETGETGIGRVEVKSGSVSTTGSVPKTEDGYYITGDLGYIDSDGFLFITGRADSKIITGGEKVDPEEIEAALRDLEGVLDAAVFSFPDSKWGESLAAVIVFQSGYEQDFHLEMLREMLTKHLAPFKVPRQVFWTTESLTGELGKKNRAAAKQKCLTNQFSELK